MGKTSSSQVQESKKDKRLDHLESQGVGTKRRKIADVRNPLSFMSARRNHQDIHAEVCEATFDKNGGDKSCQCRTGRTDGHSEGVSDHTVDFGSGLNTGDKLFSQAIVDEDVPQSHDLTTIPDTQGVNTQETVGVHEGEIERYNGATKNKSNTLDDACKDVQYADGEENESIKISEGVFEKKDKVDEVRNKSEKPVTVELFDISLEDSDVETEALENDIEDISAELVEQSGQTKAHKGKTLKILEDFPQTGKPSEVPSALEKQCSSKYSEMLWLNMLNRSKEPKTSNTISKPSKEANNGKSFCKAGGKELENVAADQPKSQEKAISYLSKQQELHVVPESKGQKEGHIKEHKRHAVGQMRRMENPATLPKHHTSCTSCQSSVSLSLPEQGFAATASPVTPSGGTLEENDYSVSPTATSMSSDVFLVKTKELDRRMAIRAELSRRKMLQQPYFSKNESYKKSNGTSVHIGNPSNVFRDENNKTTVCTERHAAQNVLKDADNTVGSKDVGASASKGVGVITHAVDKRKGRDTISEVIDSVIEQSRDSTKGIGNTRKLSDMNKANEKCLPKQKLDSQIIDLTGKDRPSIAPVVLVTGQISEQEPHKSSETVSKVLPSLKELIDSGKVLPGKNVLKVNFKGIHMASLTNQGRITTAQGLIFHTASKWLSSLGMGVNLKKRKSYQQIHYKGRSLLDYCTNSNNQSYDSQLSSSIFKRSQNSVSVNTIDQEVQVEMGLLGQTHQMSLDEKWLNQRLSTSVVQLLNRTDFVKNDDLPLDFWSADYSKVKLPVTLWNAVDCW